ncbi:unnamed protein product [Heligmosomoides polygyrus]|uniref:Transmembrane protein n=1 Tax=Heligmosomoides polygyrus TaxID=6339 RepID=A0A183FAR5_HELPZ|nr:unnamed protein product [Heligmosomoides polygyrus]
MGKKNKNLVSQHIDFEEENEELQDEVDTFHAKDRKLAANAYKKRAVRFIRFIVLLPYTGFTICTIFAQCSLLGSSI